MDITQNKTIPEDGPFSRPALLRVAREELAASEAHLTLARQIKADGNGAHSVPYWEREVAMRQAQIKRLEAPPPRTPRVLADERKCPDCDSPHDPCDCRERPADCASALTPGSRCHAAPGYDFCMYCREPMAAAACGRCATCSSIYMPCPHTCKVCGAVCCCRSCADRHECRAEATA